MDSDAQRLLFLLDNVVTESKTQLVRSAAATTITTQRTIISTTDTNEDSFAKGRRNKCINAAQSVDTHKASDGIPFFSYSLIMVVE